MFLNHTNDALSAAGDVHTAIFENESIRVLKVVVPAHYQVPMHWHPRNMIYVLAPGTFRFSFPNDPSKDVELALGQVLSGSKIEHAAENIGDTEVQLLVIEFKQNE